MCKPNFFLQNWNCTATLAILARKVPKRPLPLRIKGCPRVPLAIAQRSIPARVLLSVSRRFQLLIQYDSNRRDSTQVINESSIRVPRESLNAPILGVIGQRLIDPLYSDILERERVEGLD